MTTTHPAQSSSPLPRPTRISRPFWKYAREHRLVLQYCPPCDRYLYYPRPYCVRCLNAELEWREVSGRGRVYSFTVVRRAASPAFADRVPYVHAIVELDEGPRMTTNIVGCAPEEVVIGLPVRAIFHDASEEVGLVFFEPER